MLVLLIIFMITAPMLVSGMRVDLPRSVTAKSLDRQDLLVVTVAPGGQLQFGDQAVTLESVVAAIQAKRRDDNQVIHVRGDRSVNYGDVIAVLDLLATNGMSKIALVTTKAKSSQ